MAQRTLVVESPREYFREAVTAALRGRQLRVQAETEFYLVNLLDSHLAMRAGPGAAGFGDEPLALILARALQGDREQLFREMKRLGDTSLFLSGFFSDHLARTPVGARYYLEMGERAYGSIAEGRLGPEGLAALYGELAERFADFADLFAEIAELAELRSNRGLIRLYQRFLLTGSPRLAERLRERGVALGEPLPRGMKH